MPPVYQDTMAGLLLTDQLESTLYMSYSNQYCSGWLENNLLSYNLLQKHEQSNAFDVVRAVKISVTLVLKFPSTYNLLKLVSFFLQSLQESSGLSRTLDYLEGQLLQFFRNFHLWRNLFWDCIIRSNNHP